MRNAFPEHLYWKKFTTNLYNICGDTPPWLGSYSTSRRIVYEYAEKLGNSKSEDAKWRKNWWCVPAENVNSLIWTFDLLDDTYRITWFEIEKLERSRVFNWQILSKSYRVDSSDWIGRWILTSFGWSPFYGVTQLRYKPRACKHDHLYLNTRSKLRLRGKKERLWAYLMEIFYNRRECENGYLLAYTVQVL